MNKIDFALVISAQFCNPNGDPLNGNRPRQDFEGYGYITDVCLKHKIRNRFLDLGESVLIVEDSRVTDGLYSTNARVRAEKTLTDCVKRKDQDAFIKEACRIWADVRAFGQVFAFKDSSGGVSISVRGPVSIREARSLEAVDVIDMQIIKGTNLETDEKNPRQKDNTTMSCKYKVSRGAYVAYGSVFPQLAGLTGFSDKDALLLKNSLATIFENDASAARPSGSMGATLYWWEHDCPAGRKNSLYVHRSLNIEPQDKFPFYSCNPESIPGIELSVL
ncbi:MAG: type I-C CRISPR-associated protein Cas7/Csd2 [Lachnospiraceae bacterium]|nr:type I-C CRISPR-associated protein Cas7/Csd2 [Lachnospiraceae bacterium]